MKCEDFQTILFRIQIHHQLSEANNTKVKERENHILNLCLRQTQIDISLLTIWYIRVKRQKLSIFAIGPSIFYSISSGFLFSHENNGIELWLDALSCIDPLIQFLRKNCNIIAPSYLGQK